MMGVPMADGALDLTLVTPDRLAVRDELRLLGWKVGRLAAQVAGVGVAGHEPERHLGTAATDQDGDAMQRRRQVDDVARVVALTRARGSRRRRACRA